MDGLLTAATASKPASDHIVEVISDTSEGGHLERQDVGQASALSNPEQIIAVLQSQPDRQHVLQILKVLDPANNGNHLDGLDIRVPSPATARILQLLVGTTIPSHWNSLDKSTTVQDRKARAALLRCLSSVAGLSSLLTQLRTLIASSRTAAKVAERSSTPVMIRDLLAVISSLLVPHDFIWRLYTEMRKLYQNEIQQQVAWKELVALLAAGRVLSIAAEALAVIQDPDGLQPTSWLGDGQEYAAWLGTGILRFVLKVELVDEPAWAAIASLFGRSLNLGYIDPLVKVIYSGLLIGEGHPQRFRLLLNKLRATEKKAVTEAILSDLQKTYLPDALMDEVQSLSTETIGGIATLCSSVLEDQPQLQSEVVEWLVKGHGGSIRTVGLRRALVAMLAQHRDTLRNFVVRCFEIFGDKLYIQHTPILVQNSNAQALLLGAGYLHRQDPASIEEIGRSGIFLNSISNRLAASSTRSRFLGMVVGMTISAMIEKPGKAMRFDLEELDTDEARWYCGLAKVEDKLCSIDRIRRESHIAEKSKASEAHADSKPSRSRVAKPSVKIVAIDEINDSEDDEEDDLLPYEKPDDDLSDSDDDPTLVQRVKPTAPLYIRDLISYLRDTDNVERFELALKTAPSLIRRKIGFGTELLEHLEELSLVLVGLQDVSKNPKFHELKLQSMIGVIVSAPVKMGKWFSSMYFDGDISQAQRSAVLTALGLSARELAGNAEEDARTLGLTTVPEDVFPSKKLPPALENFYAIDESPITSLAKQISRISLQPLAAQAADSVSGPNALKVRTFSSRMEVEKRRQERDAQRQKATVKDLHKVLSEGFFFPLKRRFEMMMIQFSSSTAPFHNPFLVPHILCLFLQTLTLILSTMGPHNPFLPTLTDESLSLILSLHTSPLAAGSEPGVLAALLSMFLAVVDLNIASGVSGEERLVTQFASQVIELRDWAGDVFDRMPAVRGADASTDPHEQVRIVAAGVMVKLGEVMERYQGRLMGVNAGFKY